MSKLPSYVDVNSSIRRGKRTYWTRIGAAFPTKDGKGFRLHLDYFPASPDAEIVLLPPKPKEGEEQ